MWFMTLSEELKWRGLIKDKTFSDESWLDKPATFYLGIDPSADSLTVGNLAILMLAKRLASAGWKAVLVMGGGTSLVGDPGGKAEERDLMSRETVVSNINGVKTQVTALFNDEKYVMVDNYDWLSKLKYVDFLREVGKHFSMTELMQRDFVIERMGAQGSGISYAEFSYSLVQGYDFWHLFKEHNVVMQIGGSDQWGNLLSGTSLIRKKEGKEVHALSMPLIINKATGQKFGKSEGGAIWLDNSKTSAFKFYQFWINSDDEAVADYLKIYTELDKPAVDELLAEHQKGQGLRLAQKQLAFEVTSTVHGRERAESVKRVSEVLFGGQDYKQLSKGELESLKTELPFVKARGSTEIVDLMVEGGLAGSKSDARRFLEANAVYVNGFQIPLEKTILSKEDSLHGFAVLRRGKNSLALVELN